MIAQHFTDTIADAALLYLLAAACQYARHGRHLDLSLAGAALFAPFVTWLVTIQFGAPPIPAVLCGLSASIAMGMAADFTAFRYLRRCRVGKWQITIASLGVYIVFENLVACLFGTDTKSLSSGPVGSLHRLGGAYYSNAQLLLVLQALTVLVSTHLFVMRTRAGRIMSVISADEQLCRIVGVRTENVRMLSLVCGIAIASIAFTTKGFDTAIVPTMGFDLVLNGIIVTLIGSSFGSWGIPLSASLLAVARRAASITFGGEWIATVGFVVVLAFLLLKPASLATSPANR